MGNPFVHVELHSNAPDQAKEFYSNLLNWKLEDMPMEGMTYTMVNVGEGTGGGMIQNQVPGAPSHWLPYILVDDIRATTDKAKSMGAEVLVDVTPIPDMGSFSVITDPTGAAIGFWETKK